MADPGESDRLTAEQRARVLIDSQLEAAGWSVQSKPINLFAGQGVAVREVIMAPGHGRADYLLYVDQRAVGVIEAKPEGTPLSGVEWQSARYAAGLPADVRLKALTLDDRLPFVFEASGSEIHFTNGYDPTPRARSLFAFPRPETLARTVRNAEADPDTATWRGQVRGLPALSTAGLRDAQVRAIQGIERSLAEQRYGRSLVQMATGAGKTYTAVTTCYRLLKHGGFRRILFLVDRNNLGTQALAEFQNYATPDDGRRFTEIFNVDMLTGAGMVASSSVVISTIQRVYAALRGETLAADDDPGLDGYVPDAPVDVVYNAQMPPESFDLVIVDEAHRSIYGVWRRVLEYFDGHIVGLTATPVKQTFGFFQQNLVSEYTYAQSVADNVNVDFDVYRIRTQVSGAGSTIEAGTVVPKVDRRTRMQRYETLDDDVTYAPSELDRAVTSKSQIRLVLETFRDRLFTEIFPGRSTVPKALIFCKDDNHAEEVVTTVREVFGAGNDFAAKITYSAKDLAVAENLAAVEGELLKRALGLSPTEFERLVVRLLERMGYGRSGAVEHSGRSGDAGIDGIISQDPLGLDRIYLQAKRYAPDQSVQRPAIQGFVGALMGAQGDRGVFITTSSFSSGARAEADRVTARIELIDGPRLAELMVRHGVGVQAETTVTLHQLDEDFFETL